MLQQSIRIQFPQVIQLIRADEIISILLSEFIIDGQPLTEGVGNGPIEIKNYATSQ